MKKKIQAAIFVAAISAGHAQAAPLSKEARRHVVRGKVAFAEAKQPADYLDAVAEFEKAAVLAPGNAELFYNLGVAQDKAGRHADAVASLKKYLEKAPQAPDAQKVEDLITEIEYRLEKADSEKSKAENFASNLEGASFTRLDVSKHFRYEHALTARGAELVYERKLLARDPELPRPADLPSQRFKLEGRRFRWPNRSWCDNDYRCDGQGEISEDGRRITLKYKPHPNFGEEAEEIYDRQSAQ